MYLGLKTQTIFAFFHENQTIVDKSLLDTCVIQQITCDLYWDLKKRSCLPVFRTVYFSPPLQYNVENQMKLQVVVFKIVYSESWEDTAADRSRWRSVLHK